MGLDGVEILMEIESRFGVELGDAECGRVRTVADVAALVASKLPRPSGACPTARTFFELRRELVAEAGVERGDVRPRTRFDALFPAGLRQPWRALRAGHPRLPPLVATPMVDAIMKWAIAIGLFLCLPPIGIIWARSGGGAGVLAIAIFMAVTIGVLRLADGVGWRLPPEVETIGDAARLIAPIEIGHDSPGQRLIAEQRVLAEVRLITSRVLGLEVDQVKPESDLVKDLKLG